MTVIEYLEVNQFFVVVIHLFTNEDFHPYKSGY